MQCRMDHIVLNVEEDERMIAFYADVMGLPTERLEAYRAGKVPFPSVRLNADTIIDLFPKRLWKKDAPPGRDRENLNHFCLALDRPQWERLKRRIADRGVEIEQGPAKRWGAHGTGISIYFRDPEGNLIEARYYERPGDPEKCLLGS